MPRPTFVLAMGRKTTTKRNEAIREAFNALDSKKFTLDYRLAQVARQFFLEPNTVYLIVKQQGTYKPLPKMSP
ncbi:MAG: hypothetical protein M9892_03325 [Bacteroidetes bacterium]|nr:hypothetical protein [Bacteroidota bacterium]